MYIFNLNLACIAGFFPLINGPFIYSGNTTLTVIYKILLWGYLNFVYQTVFSIMIYTEDNPEVRL